MSAEHGLASADQGSAAMAKVRWRLIPFLFLLYIVAYLDRVNVGFAAIDMNRDLGFSAAVYGLGSGIFFASNEQSDRDCPLSGFAET